MGNTSNHVSITDSDDVPVFQHGRDELDDIQISTASKKRFIEWWRFRNSSAFPVRTHKGVVDSTKVIRLGPNGIDIVGATFRVVDYTTQEMPFNMNAVDSFILEMPALRSFKNCPKYCKTSGQFGSAHVPMLHVDTLEGCPLRITSLSLYTMNKMKNLVTSFTYGDVESLSIDTPEFQSFAGLNRHVRQVNIVTWKQQSFKGIHRDLHDIDVLTVTPTADPRGEQLTSEIGVLPFAMMDAGIEIFADASRSFDNAWNEAMAMVNTSRKEGLNVHDIQERLMDAGYGKYAKL